MRGQLFQLRTPTIGIVSSYGRTTAVMIPANEAITLIGNSPAGRRFVTIEWNGKLVEMFIQDFRDRSERIPTAAAA